jgi:hypothetical protein
MSSRRRTLAWLLVASVFVWGVAAGFAIPLSLGATWWWLMEQVDLPNTLLGATLSAAMGGSLAVVTAVCVVVIESVTARAA